jgi:hypothetical protein
MKHIYLVGKWLTWISCAAVPMEILGKYIASAQNIVNCAQIIAELHYSLSACVYLNPLLNA